MRDVSCRGPGNEESSEDESVGLCPLFLAYEKTHTMRRSCDFIDIERAMNIIFMSWPTKEGA